MYKVTQIIHELKCKISRKQINILISVISTVIVMKWLNGFLQINRLSHSIWSVFAAVSVYFILQHYDKIQKNIDCRRKKICFLLFCIICSIRNCRERPCTLRKCICMERIWFIGTVCCMGSVVRNWILSDTDWN